MSTLKSRRLLRGFTVKKSKTETLFRQGGIKRRGGGFDGQPHSKKRYKTSPPSHSKFEILNYPTRAHSSQHIAQYTECCTVTGIPVGGHHPLPKGKGFHALKMRICRDLFMGVYDFNSLRKNDKFPKLSQVDRSH